MTNIAGGRLFWETCYPVSYFSQSICLHSLHISLCVTHMYFRLQVYFPVCGQNHCDCVLGSGLLSIRHTSVLCRGVWVPLCLEFACSLHHCVGFLSFIQTQACWVTWWPTSSTEAQRDATCETFGFYCVSFRSCISWCFICNLKTWNQGWVIFRTLFVVSHRVFGLGMLVGLPEPPEPSISDCCDITYSPLSSSTVMTLVTLLLWI